MTRMKDNDSSLFGDGLEVICATDITATAWLSGLPDMMIGILTVCIFFAFLSLVVYAEEIAFLLRHFPVGTRRNKTIWILAYFPVFSVTAMLAVLVPLSSTIIDIVANTFFATCLYQFVGLITLYLGGKTETLALISVPRDVPMNVPPLCCCCTCLPKLHLTRKTYPVLQLTAIQFAVVRPLLMFIAAVLWSNGSYIAGSMSPYNAYLYIIIINIVSTMIAMYGLMLIKRAFLDQLEGPYRLSLKVTCLQLSLIITVFIKIITGVLVYSNVIHCTEFLPSKARAEVINHCVITVIMAIFGVLGRFAFRRKEDAMETSHVMSSSLSSPSMDSSVVYVGEGKDKDKTMSGQTADNTHI